MKHETTLRPGSPADIGACAAICFEAFSGINNRHGFPPDFPSVEAAGGLMEFMLNHPRWG